MTRRPILCAVDGEECNLTDDEISALFDDHGIEILDDTALFCPCCIGGVIKYRYFYAGPPNQKGGRCNKCEDVVHWHTNMHLDESKQSHIYIKNGKLRMVVPLDENQRIAVIS